MILDYLAPNNNDVLRVTLNRNDLKSAALASKLDVKGLGVSDLAA